MIDIVKIKMDILIFSGLNQESRNWFHYWFLVKSLTWYTKLHPKFQNHRAYESQLGGGSLRLAKNLSIHTWRRNCDNCDLKSCLFIFFLFFVFELVFVQLFIELLFGSIMHWNFFTCGVELALLKSVKTKISTILVNSVQCIMENVIRRCDFILCLEFERKNLLSSCNLWEISTRNTAIIEITRNTAIIVNRDRSNSQVPRRIERNKIESEVININSEKSLPESEYGEHQN